MPRKLTLFIMFRTACFTSASSAPWPASRAASKTMNPSDPATARLSNYFNHGIGDCFFGHLLGAECHIEHSALEAGNCNTEYAFRFLTHLLVRVEEVLWCWNGSSRKVFPCPHNSINFGRAYINSISVAPSLMNYVDRYYLNVILLY